MRSRHIERAVQEQPLYSRGGIITSEGNLRAEAIGAA